LPRQRVGKPKAGEHRRRALEDEPVQGPGVQARAAAGALGHFAELPPRPRLRGLEHPDHLLRGFVGEGQQAAGDDPSAVQLDHPRADPVPRRERPGRGALADADRLAAAQEVAGQERLAGHDAAHLVEAHHRAAQRLHVTPVGDRLLPAAAPYTNGPDR
jgi:hypothetical protein